MESNGLKLDACSTVTDYEHYIYKNADHFTVARGRGFNRTIEKADCFTDALKIAKRYNDGKSMIYAVTSEGRSAHIANH